MLSQKHETCININLMTARLLMKNNKQHKRLREDHKDRRCLHNKGVNDGKFYID